MQCNGFSAGERERTTAEKVHMRTAIRGKPEGRKGSFVNGPRNRTCRSVIQIGAEVWRAATLHIFFPGVQLAPVPEPAALFEVLQNGVARPRIYHVLSEAHI